MRSSRGQLVALWLSAIHRPRWQLPPTAVVSVWTLVWIIGQFGEVHRSPLDVLRPAFGWTGVPTGCLDAVSDWLRDPGRHRVLTGFAVLGGLLWAATTRRRQLPALGGWMLVAAAAEGIGYSPAVHRAVLAMVVFVALLLMLSLPNRRVVVDRRWVLLPRDVLLVGVTAAALSAMVPLLAFGLAVTWLCRPYLTRPPRIGPTVAPIPSARGDDDRSTWRRPSERGWPSPVDHRDQR